MADGGEHLDPFGGIQCRPVLSGQTGQHDLAGGVDHAAAECGHRSRVLGTDPVHLGVARIEEGHRPIGVAPLDGVRQR